MPIRILVAAADALARAGLATLLNNQPNCFVTGQIASENELTAATLLYQPDVIVWDFGVVARDRDRINFRELNIPVVALLAEPNPASDLWSAGVRGLLLRDATAERIATAVAAVVENLVVIDPAFASALFPSREPFPAHPIEELTPRELEVLRLMAEGQSNKTIARALEISEHTVKFHVNAILGKLNVQSRTEAVVHATRLGLILL